MVNNYKRKTNRAAYPKETLQAAVSSVRNGFLSGYQAAKEFKIPRMTIMDHVHNKRITSKSLGRSTALPFEVEKRLASCLHFMERHGFGLSKSEILQIVERFVKDNKIQTSFKDGKPGNAWFNGFKKRHHLTIKKPQAVEYTRKKAMNPFIVYPYYDLLEKTLKNLNLLEKPSAIWNIDETSFSKDPSKTKIVGLKGHAATRVISSTGKENTTVLLGGNACGDKLPPLIIYKGKHMWDTWMSPEAYPNTTYAATRNGWMESDVFERYFKKSFLPAIGDERPVLLIYDGHATHVGINVIEAAREANVTVLKLPAHTSHVLQPLDVAVMKPFKDRWDQLLVQWQRLNVGTALSKKEFSRLIGLVWAQIDPQILRSGFRKAGIFPFNPKMVEENFDSLKLEHWKDQQKKCQNNPNEVQNPDVQNIEFISDSIDTRHTTLTTSSKNPKSLLSLALEIVTNLTSIQTHGRLEDLRPRHNFMKRLHNHKVTNTENSENETGSVENEYRSSNVKKIQILDDRIITFEELLLMTIKAGSNIKMKRQKMGPGAEVITHDDVLKRKMEENIIKNIKKEPKQFRSKIQKDQHIIEPVPGPSGVTKNTLSDEEKTIRNYKKVQNEMIKKEQKHPKGKGIGKKSRTVEKQKTSTNSLKKKRLRVTSEDSTSVSDCISIYSDFDTCSDDDLLTEISKINTQRQLQKTIEIYESEKDNRDKEDRDLYSRKQEYKELIDIEQESREHEIIDEYDVIFNEKEVAEYAANDNVLVRYFYRKKWTYYIGYVEGQKTVDDDEVYYSIRFYKTVKNPLSFMLTKKIDRDDVPYISIVKKNSLIQDLSNPKKFLLRNDNDTVYFSV